MLGPGTKSSLVAAAAVSRPGTLPTALVVTRDGDLFAHVQSIARPPWKVEAAIDERSTRESLATRNVRLAVIDDEALLESERGWLIDQIHRRVPEAAIVYIASRHGPELERAIRSRGVLYYTSRPVDGARFDRILESVFAVRAGAAADA